MKSITKSWFCRASPHPQLCNVFNLAGLGQEQHVAAASLLVLRDEADLLDAFRHVIRDGISCEVEVSKSLHEKVKGLKKGC